MLPFNKSISCALLLFMTLFILIHPSSAKLDSGNVHLSGVKTESTLVKFAVSKSSTARIDVNFTSYGMYENEQELKLRIYTDDDWRTYTKTPLCSDKIKLAQRAIPIVFDYYGTLPDDRKGKNKRKDKVEMYKSRIQHEINNPPWVKNPSSRNPAKKKDRSRYFYFVVDDCSLERYAHDSKVPDIIYDISIQNGRTNERTGEVTYEHLPADEDGIGYLLVMTVIFSGILTMLLFYRLARSVGGEVHVAIRKFP